eukprot:TRINITY_DN8873_c0_g1_i1.p1 TRINITY_DN8873_c0_g1~~TRINITY_DN8873_c0_g1_i1.p1  ORF type:complete len:228 (+),score=57.91 TRINITY_DN8873_c0_g1_i1:92-775(+)
MPRRPARYVINLRLSVLLVFIDVIFTGCVITVHHSKRSVEDLINIGLLSIHGVFLFGHLGLIWLSVSPTVKYKAGLIGELTKITLWPTSITICRMGIMSFPWVYRRWILKGVNAEGMSNRGLYWDDWLYRIVMFISEALLFSFVYSVAKMHYQLTKTANYVTAEQAERVDEARLVQNPAFFTEARTWTDAAQPSPRRPLQRGLRAEAPAGAAVAPSVVSRVTPDSIR